MKKRFLYSFIGSLVLGPALSLYVTPSIKVGLYVSPFFVIFFFVFLYFRTFKKVDTVQFKYNPDDHFILYGGLANHYVDDYVNVGGNLYLLKDKLIFQTNNLNISLKHECVIELNEIRDISLGKIFGIIDKDLIVSGLFGEHRFTVSQNNVWKLHIEDQMKTEQSPT